MTQNISKNRIEWIDALRGFAILLVVMGHIYDKGFGIEGTSFNDFYNGFHMPLFFFISGCFFKTCNIKTFCLKKLRRLWQPILMLEIIPIVLMGNIGKQQIGWFPPTLIIVTTLFYVVFNVCDKIKSDSILALLMGSLVMWGGLDVAYLCGLDFPFFLASLKSFPFFVLGYFWMKSPFLHSWAFNKYVLGVSLIGYVIFMQNFQWNHSLSIVAIFAIVILTNLFKRITNKRILNYLSMLGTCSFEIYYFHMLFVPKIHQLSHYLLDNYAFIFALTITLSIAFIIIYLVLIIVRLLKSTVWLHSLLFGK